MRRAVLICGAMAALPGCNSQPTVTAQNASVSEVAAKAQNALRIEPGQWSNKTDVTDLDMPGMADANMAKVIKDSMKKSGTRTFTYCVTPEEAAKPSSEMFAGKDSGDCKYQNFKMEGGRIEATMQCARGKDNNMTMAMSGTYSPTKYDMTMDMKITGAMPGGSMTMKARTTGSRVSAECPAGKAS